MRILVLHSDIAEDAPPEEQDTLVAAQAVAAALQSRGHAVSQQPFTPDPPALHALLACEAPEIVFNLVEGVEGLGRLAPIAPRLLDAMGFAFTGAGAAAMDMTNDKPLTKRRLRDAGLATPDWSEPPDWRGLDDGTYIVKSAAEDASLGLDDGCVVTGAAVIVRQALEKEGKPAGHASILAAMQATGVSVVDAEIGADNEIHPGAVLGRRTLCRGARVQYRRVAGRRWPAGFPDGRDAV